MCVSEKWSLYYKAGKWSNGSLYFIDKESFDLFAKKFILLNMNIFRMYQGLTFMIGLKIVTIVGTESTIYDDLRDELIKKC